MKNFLLKIPAEALFAESPFVCQFIYCTCLAESAHLNIFIFNAVLKVMDTIEGIAYDFSRVFCRLAAKALNYRLKVYGRENMPEGRAIIAANHTSYLDPIFLGIGLGRINFIARDLNPDKKPINELFQLWLGLIGVIKIDREKPSKTDLTKILCKLEKGNKVVIFPEGTRSIDCKLGNFNGGVALIAELSESPVVPVSIKGAYEIWPRYKGIKYSGNATVRVGKALYLNKDINNKLERRSDLTEKIRTQLLYSQ